jgi:hypothetical protein
MRPLAALVAVATVFAAQVHAAEEAQRYALSIYSAAPGSGDALFAPAGPDNGQPGGYAVVRGRRAFTLEAGHNIVRVRELSRYADPAALNARAIGDDAAVIETQRFLDETVSFDALVQQHLGDAVEVFPGANAANAVPVSGKLLSGTGGLSVQTADGRVVTVTEYNRVAFPDLPGGLAATPSLRWDVEAKKAGPQRFEIVYPTQGLAWRAEYAGWLASGDCRLNLAGWAQIANRTGNDYAGAAVKLIAGEPNRVAATPQPRLLRAAAAAPLQAEDSGTVGDYHEYTLAHPVDLASGTLLRAALFPEQALPCRRDYVFEASQLRANAGMAPITERNYGSQPAPPVRSALSFKAERALPAGRLRVLQADAGGAPEFIGEDDLGHTPRGENLTIELGNAFDLRGDRKQTDFQIDRDHRTLSESFAIRLSNGGDAGATVVVREHLYRWTQWKIAEASAKYAKRDADTIDFSVDVPANGNASVSYTVQYQWSESLR